MRPVSSFNPLFFAAPEPVAGGISPITRDFVNPERPWPHLLPLAETTAQAGFNLVPRLALYPEYLPLLGATNTEGTSTTHTPSTPDAPSTSAAPGALPTPSTPALPSRWLYGGGGPEGIRAAVLRHCDSSGYVRGEKVW